MLYCVCENAISEYEIGVIRGHDNEVLLIGQ